MTRKWAVMTLLVLVCAGGWVWADPIFHAGETIWVSGISTDADLDLLTFDIWWFINDVEARIVDGLSSVPLPGGVFWYKDKLSGALTTKNDVVECRVRAYDGEIYSDWTIQQITIRGWGPSAPTVEWSKTEPVPPGDEM